MGGLAVVSDTAMAQVDHFDEVVEARIAVGAAWDESDAGVDAFDAGVG
jgi:hypothetical protein